MQFTNYKRIICIHRLLLKRYGKGILSFLNIFFASIIILLIFTLFSVIKTTTPELAKQLIVFFITMLFIGDMLNVFAIINVDTVLSISVQKIYPLSSWRRLKLIYFSFFKHNRSIIYILPTLYIGYLLIGSPVSFAILILGLVVLYLTATLALTLLFCFLDFIKYKYGVKKIALLFLPIFLLPTFLDDTRLMFDNIFIESIYYALLKLVL